MISAFGVEHGISKSLVNGVFKPATALSRAERQAMGGYKKAKGMSEAHSAFKVESAERHKALEGMPAEQVDHSYLHTPIGTKAVGATYKLGGKKNGRTVVGVVGTDRKAMSDVLSHERQHAAPKRSEYRLHGQIVKDPVKTMREEARADATSDVGHYKKKRRAAMTGKPVSVYQASAITGKPSHLQRAYPHITNVEAKHGIKAYKETQNKIARSRGEMKPEMSRKKKAAIGGVTLAGVTGSGALAHQVKQKKAQRG